ncbi:hypothetical protein ADUPG1_014037 [Aduncisulcus paluster]|uniref:Uncharacterized protein n=1 Tax=Aduncisulcus paluster TaxID=2918883 RepID=A0ABQ5K8D0_9EUKA|nr:hypothetical protein ADUPG1_014037 [Aduncisulcus paluster]|eukprot:gnl/Carplike_NY0171/10240_a14410_213.p1 GENE.gnl/Carplike_NY0171/10240_a14410_213~~gnl/Carplike_NY0171/10240_a14410_213.p1  ORF type:complete len:113 (-),score=22.25 gnl/Carplike_NY0171/10240_a14410_213:32-370(-)
MTPKDIEYLSPELTEVLREKESKVVDALSTALIHSSNHAAKILHAKSKGDKESIYTMVELKVKTERQSRKNAKAKEISSYACHLVESYGSLDDLITLTRQTILLAKGILKKK